VVQEGIRGLKDTQNKRGEEEHAQLMGKEKKIAAMEKLLKRY